MVIRHGDIRITIPPWLETKTAQTFACAVGVFTTGLALIAELGAHPFAAGAYGVFAAAGVRTGFLRSLVRTPPAFSYSLMSLPYFRPTPDRNEAFANPLASFVNPLAAFGLAKARTVKAKAAKGFPKAASG